MKVTAKDVLALSKAGYTAEQIDAYVTELEKLPDDSEDQEEKKKEEKKDNSTEEASEEEKKVSEENENFKDASKKLEEEVKKLEEELKKAREVNSRRDLSGEEDSEEKAYKELCNKISMI